MSEIKKYVPFAEQNKYCIACDGKEIDPNCDACALTPDEIDERGARAINKKFGDLFTAKGALVTEEALARAYREEFAK